MAFISLQRKDVKMPTLAETVSADPIRAAVWGVSGSAKTVLAGRMAFHEKLRPIYFADWDRRIVSLRSVIPQELWPFISSDVYTDVNVQGEGWTNFEAKMTRIAGEGFKTVVIDSVTFMLMGIMARVLMLDGKPSTSNPQLQHYLSQQSMIKDMLMKLCSKKMNVICNFHEANDKDEFSGRMFKAFAITGKLIESVPGYFNEIWHTEISQAAPDAPPAYMVRTKSDAVYMARTTFKSLKTLEKQEEIWQKVIDEKTLYFDDAIIVPPPAPRQITIGK
jgi:AAA domain